MHLVTQSKKLHLLGLDALRGGAALQVMLGHTIWYLWESDASMPFWNVLEKLVAFCVRYGAQAVVLFFLLSGFVIHLRQAKQALLDPSAALPFNTWDYIKRRARRLYPPLITALILTAVLDHIGTSTYPALYAGDIPYTFEVSFRTVSHSLLTLLGNLFFLQNLIPGIHSFGTNSPLWTLAYEAVFYLLYPLVLLPLYRRLGEHRTFGVALVFSLIMLPLAGYACILRVLAYFGMWALGAWLADLTMRGVRLPRPQFWLIGASTGVIILMFGYSWGIHNIVRDWLWAICLAILIILAVDDRPSLPFLVRLYYRGICVLAPLAPSSYTLYVIHGPIMALVVAIWLSMHDILPRQGWLAMGTAALIIVIAMLLAEVVEKPFLSSKPAPRLWRKRWTKTTSN